MKFRLAAVLCGLTVLLVGACSSGKASKGASTWNAAEARQQYLAYVAPVNAEETKLKALKPNANLPAWTSECAKIGRVFDTFQRQLEAGKWPKSAQPDVNELVHATGEQHTVFVLMSQAKSLGQLHQIIDSKNFNTAALDGDTASQDLRVVLGLPSTSR